MGGKVRQVATPIVLICCALVVSVWEIAAHRSRRQFQPFDLTSDDFSGFVPSIESWTVKRIPQVTFDPTAPTLFSCDMRGKAGMPVVVRLVHGYNMPMCMKLKGYDVQLMEDIPFSPSTRLRSDSYGGQAISNQPSTISHQAFPLLQRWRLVSGAGDVSLWVTAMIRAGDFEPTDVDIRSMAFPRIAAQENPDWVPRGLTWDTFRHPVRDIRNLIVRKWSNARCDLATFLRLRQPAWASEDLLTLVACSAQSRVRAEDERAVAEEARDAHGAMLGALHKWRQSEVEKR